MNLLNKEDFDPAQALLDWAHGDPNLLRELVDLFGTEVPGILASIKKAIQQGSAFELEKAGHQIKGSILQLSAHAAVNTAVQLEEKRQIGFMAENVWLKKLNAKKLMC